MEIALIVVALVALLAAAALFRAIHQRDSSAPRRAEALGLRSATRNVGA